MALLLFGGLGLAAFVGGCLWGLRRYGLYRDGLRTDGQVVENFTTTTVETDSNRNKYQSVSYYPIVEFLSRNGQTVRFRGSTGSSVPDYQVGARVRVIYRPSDPAQAQIDTFSQVWLGPVALGVCGFVLLVLGVGSFALIRESDAAVELVEQRAAATAEQLRSLRQQSQREGSDPAWASSNDRR